MAEPFTLTAVPMLLPEGEHKGHLEYVQFIATDGYTTEKWTSKDDGVQK